MYADLPRRAARGRTACTIPHQSAQSPRIGCVRPSWEELCTAIGEDERSRVGSSTPVTQTDAARTAAATVAGEPCQGAPCPGSTHVASRSDSRSSESTARAGSSVNGAG